MAKVKHTPSSDEILKAEEEREAQKRGPEAQSVTPVEPEKPTETREASVGESEDLQKQGWRVVAVRLEGFKKVHILTRK